MWEAGILVLNVLVVCGNTSWESTVSVVRLHLGAMSEGMESDGVPCSSPVQDEKPASTGACHSCVISSVNA